jgi:hypothetical protein
MAVICQNILYGTCAYYNQCMGLWTKQCGLKAGDKFMPEIWKPQSIDVYKDWLVSILIEATDKLNDWELSFITNIDMRLGNGIQLTETQAEKLEQIYVKYTK